MNATLIRSAFEYDEHIHTVITEGGDLLARVMFTGMSDGRDGAVTAEASVKFLFGDLDSPAILEYQRVNLVQAKGQNGWTKISDKLKLKSAHEWEELVQLMVSASMSEWRQASSSVEVLEEINPDEVDAPFLLRPYVSAIGMTHLYGPQGAGKSMLTMGICVALTTGYPIFGEAPEETGNVLYCDFEDESQTQRPRLTAVLEGIEWEGERRDIIHYQAAGKLTDHVARIRRLARQHDVVATVIDSLGRARGGDPSDGGATIQLANAIGSIPGPVIAIDHVTKAIKELADEGRLAHPESVSAIGSQFSGASARLGWFIQRMTTSTPEYVRFNLENNKYNLVAKQRSRSLSMGLKWNERDVLTEVNFKAWDSIQFTDDGGQEVRQKIAEYMIDRQLSTLDATSAAAALKEPRTTIIEGFKDASWFLKLPKAGRVVPFKLTDYGRDEASRLKKVNNPEMQQQQGLQPDDGM